MVDLGVSKTIRNLFLCSLPHLRRENSSWIGRPAKKGHVELSRNILETLTIQTLSCDDQFNDCDVLDDVETMCVFGLMVCYGTK